MTRNRLREGFTTGTAAAAAAKAALIVLLQDKAPERVDTPLPGEGRLMIPVDRAMLRDDGAEAVVVKDGGDDPDATHKARIRVLARFRGTAGATRVAVKGGSGVGVVTRPGLPVPVGEAAINPAPRLQIEASVREALIEAGTEGEVEVTVEVEDGERIARKTLNPRLGILGGISILGTRGTVKPFSNQAYRDTITVSMDVARSQGLSTVALATGGKSERLLRGLMPDLPDATWIQVGDFFAFSLKEAAKRGFEAILYACFFGKLVKMAQGHPHTHARKGRIDFEELASWCTAGGLSREDAAAVRRANTSREALGIIRKDPAARRILGDAVTRAMGVARGFLGPGIVVAFYLFDFDETLLETRTEPSQERTWTP